MINLEIVDWSDDAYQDMFIETGNYTSKVVARIQLEKFNGFSYDGGRLDIDGHSVTIYVNGSQFSINVVE